MRVIIAGMRSLAIPLVGVISARLQLGERPGPFEAVSMLLIGLALIILSVYALQAGAHTKSGGVK
jgi:hypothetical protein